MAERNPQLEAARRRRLLAQLDRALARQGVKPPPRRPVTPAASTQARRLRATMQYEGARRSYGELRRAIEAEGGIRPNRDYPSREIPRELRRKPGAPGLAPDVMAQVLVSHGFAYDGDDELVQDIHRRREQLEETHEQARSVAAKHGPSVVCTDTCRNPQGMFARCETAARRAVRYCRERWRDAIGRFRSDPKRRRR